MSNKMIVMVILMFVGLAIALAFGVVKARQDWQATVDQINSLPTVEPYAPLVHLPRLDNGVERWVDPHMCVLCYRNTGCVRLSEWECKTYKRMVPE